jgi:hypothetical protein
MNSLPHNLSWIIDGSLNHWVIVGYILLVIASTLWENSHMKKSDWMNATGIDTWEEKKVLGFSLLSQFIMNLLQHEHCLKPFFYLLKSNF